MARRGKRLPTYLEPDEIDTLLAAAKTPLQRLYFLLCARAGLRAFEACKVRWDDITWRDGRAFLRVLGKGDKEAELPLHESIQASLQELGTSVNSVPPDSYTGQYITPKVGYLFPGREPGSHIVTRCAQHWMTKTCRRAGIEAKKAHLHALRHSFATHLLRGGVNIRDVQDLMRHSNLSTTSRYLHTTPERLTAAVDVLR